MRYPLGSVLQIAYFISDHHNYSVRIVDANDREDVISALTWLETDGAVVYGIDCEWVAENCANKINPICLLQIASETKVLLISTQGKSRPEGSEEIAMFINDPTKVKVGVGIETDQLKLCKNFGTKRWPENYVDLQDCKEVKKLSISKVGFNAIVEEILLKQTGKQLSFPLSSNNNPRLLRLTTFSDWSVPAFTMEQILYSSFDAVGARLAYLLITVGRSKESSETPPTDEGPIRTVTEGSSEENIIN